eukprot:7388109-Prymnesium_polylepis.3
MATVAAAVVVRPAASTNVTLTKYVADSRSFSAQGDVLGQRAVKMSKLTERPSDGFTVNDCTSQVVSALPMQTLVLRIPVPRSSNECHSSSADPGGPCHIPVAGVT